MFIFFKGVNDEEHQLPAEENCPSPKRPRRGTRDILTPELTATCDALGVSSRAAAAIINATIHALGLDINDYNVNFS